MKINIYIPKGTKVIIKSDSDLSIDIDGEQITSHEDLIVVNKGKTNLSFDVTSDSKINYNYKGI